MPRGTQLATLLAMTRHEARMSDSVALGRNSRAAIVGHIQRVQRQLWLDHDWEHMKVYRDVELAAGQQFYDFPSDLSFERVIWVKVRESTTGLWLPSGDASSLPHGIGPEHYNVYDSEADVRSAPVLRWAYHADATDNGDQIEVWPLPSDNTQVLRLRGIRSLGSLAADTDTADLDDDMIATMVAAELLAHAGAKDAQAKLAAAQRIMRRLTGRAKKNKMFVMGGGSAQSGDRKPVELRAVYNAS
jgi:hypothetical protein